MQAMHLHTAQDTTDVMSVWRASMCLATYLLVGEHMLLHVCLAREPLSAHVALEPFVADLTCISVFVTTVMFTSQYDQHILMPG